MKEIQKKKNIYETENTQKVTKILTVIKTYHYLRHVNKSNQKLCEKNIHT